MTGCTFLMVLYIVSTAASLVVTTVDAVATWNTRRDISTTFALYAASFVPAVNILLVGTWLADFIRDRRGC